MSEDRPGAILFIRHAASTGPGPDATLSSAGEDQAHTLIPALAAWGPTDLFTSPFMRARATIAPFAAGAGQDVRVIDALRERSLGPTDLPDWQAHIARSFSDHDHKPDGGESLREVQARTMAVIREILAEARGSRPAAVSHGGWISALLHGIDPSFGFDQWRNLANPDLILVQLRGTAPVAWRRLLKE